MVRDAIQGEQPSASHINEIRDHAVRPSAGMNSMTGIGSMETIPARIALFRISQAMTLDADSNEWYTKGQRVAKDGDEYTTIAGTPEEDLWQLNGLRVSETTTGTGNGSVGIPMYGVGDHVLVYNTQEGKREILSKPEDIWRFQLTGSSDYGFQFGGSASAVLVREVGGVLAATSVAFTVYDPNYLFAGYYQGGVGTLGWCKWMADMERWEIIAPSNTTAVQYGKATADWSDNGASWDTVVVQRCDKSGNIIDSTNITVYLEKTGRTDPAVYSGDVISFTYDDSGDPVNTSSANDALYEVIQWHTEASIPTGWVECNGGALPGDKKVSVSNAPGQAAAAYFWMHRYVAGAADENAIDDTGGLKDEELHRHQIDTGTWGTADVATGTDHTVVASSPTPWTSGQDNMSGAGVNVRENRPPYVGTKYIFRYK